MFKVRRVFRIREFFEIKIERLFMVVFVLDHSLDLLSNRFEFFVDFFLPFFLLIFELENLELLINVRWCGATGT
jgi:hypothetical protein